MVSGTCLQYEPPETLRGIFFAGIMQQGKAAFFTY